MNRTSSSFSGRGLDQMPAGPLEMAQADVGQGGVEQGVPGSAPDLEAGGGLAHDQRVGRIGGQAVGPGDGRRPARECSSGPDGPVQGVVEIGVV